MAMGFMNKFKNKLETYAVIIQTLENVVLETVASYKQGHCLGRKNFLPRHCGVSVINNSQNVKPTKLQIESQNVREIPPKQPRFTCVCDGRSYH